MNREKWEVSLEDLVWIADPTEFTFANTVEIHPPVNPIDIVKGQHDAKQTLLSAIKLRQNAILIGPAGCGKSLLAKTVAEQFSLENANKIKLYDQCLIYNLENEFEPDVISLPTPLGKQFAEDFRTFIKYIRAGAHYRPTGHGNPQDTKITFRTHSFFSTTEYSGTLKQLLEGVAKQNGLTIVPDADVLFKHSIRMLDAPVLTDGKDYFTLRILCPHYEFDEPRNGKSFILDNLVQTYKYYPKVLRYFGDMAREVRETEEMKGLFDMEQPFIKKMREEKYMINVIVNNAETVGVPVEYIENPSIQNIIGEAGHDAYNLRPMHMRIKPGKLHRGNGGIVIIDELITVLQDQYMRNFLLTVLNDKQGRIGGGAGLSGGGTSAGVETKPVAADCIVIGCANDDVFKYMTDKIARRFQHKVKFHTTMDNTLENRMGYAEFIAYEINKYNNDSSNQVKLSHCTPEAVAAVVEWGVRFAQNAAHGKKKLTNVLDPVALLVKSAAMKASQENAPLVERIHVQAAREELRRLSTQMQTDYLTYINEGLISIEVDGFRERIVNGLVVIKDNYGLVAYGFPTRLIATASQGKGGFLSSEKEAGLSGKIMLKTHEIIKTYFNATYGKALAKVNLSVSFAQSYSSIDGDSASIATVIALKSALSGMPVDQGLAVTGSMNELGEIQPIGGVNEKIEGFYAVCKQKGFTRKQGVIIPPSNVPDLMLAKDVIDDVCAGNFHVYSVKHLDEAVELMFAKPAQDVDRCIRKKLEEYWREDSVTGKR